MQSRQDTFDLRRSLSDRAAQYWSVRATGLNHPGGVHHLRPEPTSHNGHFYGGPKDGEVHELAVNPLDTVPALPETPLLVFGDGSFYEYVGSVGSSVPEDCRDHIYRHLPED